MAPFFLPPRCMARMAVSMILAKGVGPVEAPPKLDFKGEPAARNLVSETPRPPEPFDSIITSATDFAICAMSSWTSRRKQFEREGLSVPAATLVEPPAIYSWRDILS